MSFTVSAWAKGTHWQSGADQAVRIQILRDEHDVNEEFGLRSNASGLYRTTYGDWAAEVGSSTVDENGHRQRYIPPGTLNSDRDGYSVPAELLEGEEEALGGGD